MRSVQLQKTILVMLITALPVISISCYTTQAVALKEVDPTQPIVVRSTDSSLYRLVTSSIDHEGNISGIGERFPPAATTPDSLLGRLTLQSGVTFRGTLSARDIGRVYMRVRDEWKTKESLGYAILTPLAIVEVGFLVLFLAFIASYNS